MGSSIPPLYYGFYCSRVLKIVYICLICSLGIICIIISLWEKFNAPEYRLLRAGNVFLKHSSAMVFLEIVSRLQKSILLQHLVQDVISTRVENVSHRDTCKTSVDISIRQILFPLKRRLKINECVIGLFKQKDDHQTCKRDKINPRQSYSSVQKPYICPVSYSGAQRVTKQHKFRAQ